MLHDNVAFQFSWWEQALYLAVCKHCPVPSGTCRWFLSQALGSFYMSVLISTLLNTAVPLCLWGIGSRTPHLPSLPTPKSADAHVSSKNGVVPKKKKKCGAVNPTIPAGSQTVGQLYLKGMYCRYRYSFSVQLSLLCYSALKNLLRVWAPYPQFRVLAELHFPASSLERLSK